MERKKSVIKHMLQRILFSGICITLLICSFALPASAAVLDYNDYISNITVDGTYDNVTLKFPESGVWYGAGSGYNHEELYVNLDSSRQTVYYAPFLYTDGVPDSLKRTDFPDDTQFELRFACRSQNVPDVGYLLFYQFDSSDRLINNDYEFIPLEIDSVGYLDYSIVTLRVGSLNFSDECYSFNFTYEFSVPGVQSSSGGSGDYTYWYYFWGADFNFSFKIDSLVRQQQNTNKQNAILNAVEKRLAEQGKTLDEVLQQQQQTNDQLGDLNDKQDQTNNKLDGLWGSITEGFSSMGDKLHDLFTGGSSGDKVTGSAGDLKDQIGNVEDFQSGVESDLEAGFDEVLDFSGLTSLAPAFAFIGTYVNKIWYDMDGLQVVFVLVFGIGVFLQLAQHTPRVPVLRSQDRSSRGTGGRNTNWYDPVSGRVVDGNLERGQARANRGS